MTARFRSVVLVVIIIAAAVAIAAIFSSQKQPMRQNMNANGLADIKTITVKNTDKVLGFEASGTISARDKIEIYAEVSGIMLETEKRFEIGVTFKKGEPLIKIDNVDYRNSVLAEKSNLLTLIIELIPDLQLDFPQSVDKWKKYLADFDFDAPIPDLPETESDRERNFVAASGIFSKFYSVKSMEAILNQYTILAPFNGVVTEANVNPGEVIMNGQSLGEFINTDIYDLEVPVSPYDAENLTIGQKVDITSQDFSGHLTGTIDRINKKIEQTSQTVKVFITLSDSRLKDGMYLTAHIKTRELKNVFDVPPSLLIDEKKLYVLKDSIVTVSEIKVLGFENGKAIVQGLTDGAILVGENVSGIYDGMVISKSGMN